MPCTHGCEDCQVHLNTTEAHLMVWIPGCIAHVMQPPVPEGCNGIWKVDHVTGKVRLVHESGPCPKHP